jgi:uncharacterized membrane protein
MTALAQPALDRAAPRRRGRPVLQPLFIGLGAAILVPVCAALVITATTKRPLPWQFHMPWVSPHLALALLTLALGIAQLSLRKGDRRHRLIGYAWCALMAGVGVSGLAVQLEPGHVTLIHRISSGFSIINLVLVPVVVFAALTGRRRLHKAAALIMFATLLNAGALAFIPQRAVGSLVFGLFH